MNLVKLYHKYKWSKKYGKMTNLQLFNSLKNLELEYDHKTYFGYISPHNYAINTLALSSGVLGISIGTLISTFLRNNIIQNHLSGLSSEKLTDLFTQSGTTNIADLTNFMRGREELANALYHTSGARDAFLNFALPTVTLAGIICATSIYAYMHYIRPKIYNYKVNKIKDEMDFIINMPKNYEYKEQIKQKENI